MPSYNFAASGIITLSSWFGELRCEEPAELAPTSIISIPLSCWSPPAFSPVTFVTTTAEDLVPDAVTVEATGMLLFSNVVTTIVCVADRGVSQAFVAGVGAVK